MVQEYDRKAIGRRLKSGLSDTGMTAEELGAQIGRSRHTVADWINGRSTPTLEDAAKVCDVFGWPLDHLATRN